MFKFSILASLLGCSLMLMTACEKQAAAQVNITKDTVVINGSSTVYPITSEAARRFMNATPGASVSVNFAGSTEGFRQFLQGDLDIANASRPMSVEERSEAQARGVRFVELTLARDAVALVTHPKNKWLTSLSLEELKKIWSPESEGKIMRWKDVRPEWPDEPIALFGRGQDSGTMDYFTQTVNGTSRAIRKDYFGSEDEEQLAEKIATTPNSIGFFGLGAYHRNWDKLKLLSVDSGTGKGPVYPSLETVADHSYGPLIRPLFLYVNLDAINAKQATLPFLKHYYTHLPQWLHFTGYFPLSKEDYATTIQSLDNLGL